MKSVVRTVAPLALSALASAAASAEAPLREQLAETPFRLVHESYVDDNWELFVRHADGSGAVNVTQTPDLHELYPQVSPDGTRICFVVDRGEGRDTVRSVHMMNIDGSERRLVADFARQPFWHPNSRVIGYLPQEYRKWNVVDYYTKGLTYFDTRTGERRPHPNSSKLHHLYNVSFSPDGRWLVGTVHAGMGHGHANLLIEAEGDRIIDLGIPGCRPTFSPDGSRLAWGPGDHELAVATVDWKADPPRVGSPELSIRDAHSKIYHIDWSPDGRFLSFSRGPKGQGDTSKPGTHQSACEIVGVYAPGWDIHAVPAGHRGTLDVETAGPDVLSRVTDTGASNKESDWIPAPER